MAVSDPKHEEPSAAHEVPAAETSGAKVLAEEPRPQRTTRGIASLRVGVLGVSAWLVAVFVPVLEGGVHSPADSVLVSLPIVALALGVRYFLRSRDEAGPLLAIAFPALLATAMAGRADPALSARYEPPLVVLSGIAMLAYVAATAHALGRPLAFRPTRVSKLAAVPEASRRARVLRIWVLGTTALFGLVLTLFVPALGSRASYAAAWGAAADEGRVLVAILGATVSTVVLTVIIAPSLRAARPLEGRRSSDSVTLAASLVVAVTGAMAWAILRFVER